jgi:uncharacterized protein (TIGR00269 family)
MTRCSACGRNEAFYFRVYSGERLCRECFLGSVENKVRVTIGKHRMFEMDDRIAVAVSGGKDSVSLLHILSKVESEFPRSNLHAVTVDEGIRGYRDEAVRNADKNCSQLGIQHSTVSFKELFGYTMDEIVRKTRGDKLTPCSYCGVLRRRALNVAAKRVNATKIATAHTLDDEVQTFLLNIVHGDPSRTAHSNPVAGSENAGLVPRVKPFCETLERESALYAFTKRIPFQEMPCPYAGDALRNDVRNALNRLEEKHPGTKYTVYASMVKVQRSFEKSAEETTLQKCPECRELTSSGLCRTCQLLKKLARL